MTVTARCLVRLTDQWQRLSALKHAPSDGARGYQDLVWAGLAEERRTPIVRHGVACGETIEYRRATP
jgi:hypothetical protein